MPRVPRTSGRFERDVKLMRRRGKDLARLGRIMQELIDEQPLETSRRDHPLVGTHVGRRECHVEPDWLLIYMLGDGWILFERTGTHSDLFK